MDRKIEGLLGPDVSTPTVELIQNLTQIAYRALLALESATGGPMSTDDIEALLVKMRDHDEPFFP